MERPHISRRMFRGSCSFCPVGRTLVMARYVESVFAGPYFLTTRCARFLQSWKLYQKWIKFTRSHVIYSSFYRRGFRFVSVRLNTDPWKPRFALSHPQLNPVLVVVYLLVWHDRDSNPGFSDYIFSCYSLFPFITHGYSFKTIIGIQTRVLRTTSSTTLCFCFPFMVILLKPSPGLKPRF